MRILFTIGDLNSGGAEKVVATLSNNFVKQNHNVGILMISESSPKTFYRIDGSIELIPVLNKNKKNSISEKVNKIKNAIESFNPDVVISFLNYVIVYTYFALKKCKNRKNVCFIVSERNNPRKVPEFLSYRLLRNHIFKKADACVFQTQEAKNYFKHINNYSIIPNPVFINSEPNRSNITQDILMVGSDKKEKNRSMAFKAFSIYKKSHSGSRLIVVGENSNKKEIGLLNKLRIKDEVMFVGRQKNWHEIYKNSKMFILSSNFEGMPNVLLEACALQIPCVSTDCPSGGPKEILENGKRGLLVPVNDHKEMANQMQYLSVNNEFYNYLSLINNDIRDKYSEKTISQRWIDFINKSLKS